MQNLSCADRIHLWAVDPSCEVQDLAAWELLGLYAGEVWLDKDIDAEQAKVPCGAGLLLFDKQMEAEVVDAAGQGKPWSQCWQR